MNFKESIANYFLGNVSVKQLPSIALIGLLENIESESLVILAGMNKFDDSWLIEKYFRKSIEELKYYEIKELEAAIIMLVYYLRKIISNPKEAYKLMSQIDYEIYSINDWKKITGKDVNYLGEELGLEMMYIWYREIQDWMDNGILLYYNEYSREIQRIKFEENLIEEAKNLLNKLEDLPFISKTSE